MGKKIKSKQRLDTYYHYARSQGYRSRAAYKLIQLNRKYNFLNSANILIDLCAAPGGWMQVAKEFMPLNSQIIGVDLVPIKNIPGTKSFQGDITTQQCYQQLRKEIKHNKCDIVLNDGAPNVGANWNKDAYQQSQLVLSALKLACNFLKEGGFFITKVFRSTDFQSLIWVFKKFFQKVHATKPKASRFSSAEIFVVCQGYLAPEYIDQKFFDAKHIFKDSEADHFHKQISGEITSIDKLLQNKRQRGGYQDNVPMHMFKSTTLTNFIEAEQPLAIFAQYNQITVSNQQRDKYYELTKVPVDAEESLKDLKVLGKREIGNLMKWRGKIRQSLEKKKQNLKAQMKSQKIVQHEDIDSDEQLEQQILQSKKKELRGLREKESKKKEALIKAQAANQQHIEDQEFENGYQMAFSGDIENLQFQQQSEEQSSYQQETSKKKKFINYSEKEMEENLEQMYQAKKQFLAEKQKKLNELEQERKQRKQDRIKHKETRLQPRKMIESIPEKQAPQEEKQLQDLVKFRNPLAGFEEEIYLSSQEESYDDELQVDPDEKVAGELSDDEAYVIPKPVSDMEKRKKQIRKNQKKKEKKLRKSINDGEQVNGHIEIVKPKKMEDYDIDSLAETLAIAKKMLRNRSREEIIDKSYSRFTFQDHDQLPKWFTDDEKKHNYKEPPITKEQFNRQKERLMAINARTPKKILQAKVRRKIRIQKKLKKTQKKAEGVMSQEGITQATKLRQIGKMYDKQKRELKNKKKYVFTKKGKTANGKDSRNIKHVDKRLKKDKKSTKVKKKRHLKRKHSRKGRF